MRFLPDAANQVVSLTIAGNDPGHLWSAWPQLGVTALWAAALVAVGAYLFRKRDAYRATRTAPPDAQPPRPTPNLTAPRHPDNSKNPRGTPRIRQDDREGFYYWRRISIL